MEVIGVSCNKNVVVVGLGEIGKPLLEIIGKHYDAVGVDIVPPVEPIQQGGIVHICYPFEIRDFVGETARYIEQFRPALTIINSTVGIGTTRAVAERTGSAVVHSPVRGKHIRMLDELYKYVKFVGALDIPAARLAVSHFESVGVKTKTLSSPEATELAKLTETTYFGLLIAWAQELERHCDRLGADYDEIVSFYEEINFFPRVKYAPGIIGGHCVMPNIDILRKFAGSAILEAIRESNNKKIRREARLDSKIEELARASWE
jgi:UDP-N-acetyl-D-mannosaminuronate dehydrogenase